MDMSIEYVVEPPVHVIDNETNPSSNPCRYNVAVTKSNDVILANIDGETPKFIVAEWGNIDEDLLFKSADDLYEHGFEDAAKYLQNWVKILRLAKQAI